MHFKFQVMKTTLIKLKNGLSLKVVITLSECEKASAVEMLPPFYQVKAPGY